MRTTSYGIVPEAQHGTPTSSRCCAACRARACCCRIASNRSGTVAKRGFASDDRPRPSTVRRWCLGITRILIHRYGIASVSEHGLSLEWARPITRKSTAYHFTHGRIILFESDRYVPFAAPYLSTDSGTESYLVSAACFRPNNHSRRRLCARRQSTCLPPTDRRVGRQKEGALRVGWLHGSYVLPILGKGAERMSGGPHRYGLGGER